MPPRKVTIEDISQKTGLSRGTVSRALNDRPDISQKTKERVLEACRSLNYVPSHAARSLATGRNLAVLAIVADLTDPFGARVVRGIINRAEQAHYGVYLLELGTDLEQATTRLRALSAERIDAALIASVLPEALVDTLREMLDGQRIASVAPLGAATCDLIGPDRAEAGRLAARQVMAFDRNTARVIVNGDDAAFAAGAREAVAGLGGQAESVVRTIAGDDADEIAEAIDSASAIAAGSDDLALRVYPHCWSRGRVIGSDVRVLGCGDTPLATAAAPALSSIDLAPDEIGSRAMDLVLQRIGGQRQDGAQTVAVAPRLIERASTGH